MIDLGNQQMEPYFKVLPNLVSATKHLVVSRFKGQKSSCHIFGTQMKSFAVFDVRRGFVSRVVLFYRWSGLPRKILREEKKVNDLLRCEVTSRNMVLLHALECTFDTQTNNPIMHKCYVLF